MSTNPAYKTSFSKGINLQQVPEERSSAASTVAIEALKHCRSEPSSPGLELKYRHIHGEASNLTLPSDAIDNWFEILNSSLEAATAAALQRLDASRIDQPSVFLRIVKDTVKYWTPRFTDAQESLNTPFERNCEDLIKALVQRHPGYVRESFILALSDAGFDIGTLLTRIGIKSLRNITLSKQCTVQLIQKGCFNDWIEETKLGRFGLSLDAVERPVREKGVLYPLLPTRLKETFANFHLVESWPLTLSSVPISEIKEAFIRCVNKA